MYIYKVISKYRHLSNIICSSAFTWMQRAYSIYSLNTIPMQITAHFGPPLSNHSQFGPRRLFVNQSLQVETICILLKLKKKKCIQLRRPTFKSLMRNCRLGEGENLFLYSQWSAKFIYSLKCKHNGSKHAIHLFIIIIIEIKAKIKY